MKTFSRTLTIFSHLSWLPTLALITLTSISAQSADIDGTWTWSTPGRNGGPERVTKLSLKADGAKLTGKLAAPGRDGAASETPIADGKLDGTKVSFVVVRQFNGNASTNHFAGTLAGDKITGKIESVRDGEKQSRDWEAKRWTESK